MSKATQQEVRQQEERMHLVFVGHVDHGKSTVIGRLLADTNSLPEGKLEQVKQRCAENARPFEYAFLLDALKNEQAQGITIDTARCFFKTGRRSYIVNDAPGHIEFLKNMVTGAARAEAALLVIDAEEGIQENSKRHGYMVSMLGVKQLSVLVNKMDLVDYSRDVFQRIEEEYRAFLGHLGVHPRSFIPISGREGCNMTTGDARTPWYAGPSVLEQVDAFERPRRPVDQPFRMPVQDIYKFTAEGDNRRIVAGNVETGVLRPGDAVTFYPSGKESTIAAIEGFNSPAQDGVGAGQATGVTVTEQIYIKAGELMCRADQAAPLVGSRFRANLFWMGHAPFVPERRYKLKIGGARVPVELSAIHNVLDASELSSVQGKRQVERHDVAECVLETLRPVAFDPVDALESTARFVIIDDYEIAGCGVILAAAEAEHSSLERRIQEREYAWDHGLVSQGDRAAQFGHYGKFIVFTGPAGIDRREIAKHVERALFKRGCRTYYLSIARLFSDLEEDGHAPTVSREEHIRQLGELARLMTDSAMLFITTLADADDFELELLKKLNSPKDIFVVNVGEKLLDRFPVDVSLPAAPDLAESVKEITQVLTLKNVLIEYLI